jgi:hypothetical protein
LPTAPLSVEDLTTEISELHGKEIQSKERSNVIFSVVRFFPFRVFGPFRGQTPISRKKNTLPQNCIA